MQRRSSTRLSGGAGGGSGRRRRLGVAPTGGRVTQRRRPSKINRSAAAAAAAVLAPRTSRRNLPGRAGSRVVAWQPLLPAVYRRDRPPSSRPPSVFSMHAEQIALRQPLSSRSAGAVAVYISLRHRHSCGGGGGARYVHSGCESSSCSASSGPAADRTVTLWPTAR